MSYLNLFDFQFLTWFVMLSIVIWAGAQSAHLPADKRRRSPQLNLGIVLVGLVMCVAHAVRISTDVRIDLWSGQDWANGGLMMLGVFAAGFGFGRVGELWRKPSSGASGAG